MQTEVRTVNPEKPERPAISKAGDVLKKGGLVAAPTETVYGLMADFSNKEAVAKIYKVKNRPLSKPLPVLVPDLNELKRYAADMIPYAQNLAGVYWPGALTLVLPARDGRNIGFRISKHAVVGALLAEVKRPLAAPSANLTGHPPPVNTAQVLRDMQGKIEMVLDGGESQVGLESTVINCVRFPFKIIREGVIKADELSNFVKTILFVCTGNSCRSVMAEYLFKKAAAGKKENFKVRSVGLAALEGTAPADLTKEVLQEEGIEAAGHIVRRLGDGSVNNADLIVVMEQFQKDEIARRYPALIRRVVLLRQYDPTLKDPNDMNIPDPIGKPKDVYKGVLGTIKNSIDGMVKLI